MKPSLYEVFPLIDKKIIKNNTVDSIKISKKDKRLELVIKDDFTHDELDLLEENIKSKYKSFKISGGCKK